MIVASRRGDCCWYWAISTPKSVADVRAALARTDIPVSVGGGHFSMGGQTASPGSLHLDMRGMNAVLHFSPLSRRIRVQAGIRWCDIQKFVDPHGLAVKVMQTYANFTVGGSLSVNAHGRYIGLGPLVSSVCAIKVVLVGGEVVEATATVNAELFYGCIGGYGALGVIVEAELELAENRRVVRSSVKLPLADYARYFGGRRSSCLARRDACVAMSRLGARAVCLRRPPPPAPPKSRSVTTQPSSVVAQAVDRRGEEQTFLTFPEWFLVFSPTECATLVRTRTPDEFCFWGHIGQFWRSYAAVAAETRRRHDPENWGYHLMIVVIGVSTTVEYAIRSAYEMVIGRFTALTARDRTEEDQYAAQVAQEYVDLIRDQPSLVVTSGFKRLREIAPTSS
jgi:hypothetical protein